MRTRNAAAADRGETLLEIIIAVAILGLAAVAILGGLTLNVKVSDIHRKEATAGAAVRNYAEAVETWIASGAAGSTHYAACASASSYSPGTVGFTPPSGYTASATAATVYTSGSGWGGCSTDPGYQRVVFTVQTNDSRAAESLAVILRNPCRPSDSSC